MIDSQLGWVGNLAQNQFGWIKQHESSPFCPLLSNVNQVRWNLSNLPLHLKVQVHFCPIVIKSNGKCLTYPSISCWSTWSLLVQQYLWLGDPQQKTSPLSSLKKKMFIFKWKICSYGSKVCILHDWLSKGLLCVSKNIIASFKRMLSKELQGCWQLF